MVGKPGPFRCAGLMQDDALACFITRSPGQMVSSSIDLLASLLAAVRANFFDARSEKYEVGALQTRLYP